MFSAPLVLLSSAPLPRHQDLLVANCFAQTEALMLGRTSDEVALDLADLPEAEVGEAGLDVKIAAIDETWSGLRFVRRLADR